MSKLIHAIGLLGALALDATAGDSVIRDYYDAPGVYPTRDYVNQHFGEHIDPFTGRLQLHYVDVFIPGNGGFDLQIQRSYSNVNDLAGPPLYSPLGAGWTLHLGRISKSNALPCDGSLWTNTLHAPVVELPDGSQQILAGRTAYSGADYVSVNRWRAQCFGGGTGLIVTSPEGVSYQMSKAYSDGGAYYWYAERITDRNGNSLSIAYTTVAGRLLISSVTASDGRFVSFGHTVQSDGTPLYSSISANGYSWSFSYAGDPASPGVWYLTAVTRPVAGAWTYDYNFSNSSAVGQFCLRSLRYPTGGTISYQYGRVSFGSSAGGMQSTVVLSKSASGGSWRFSYAPSTGFGIADATTVTTPSGTEVYRHVGWGTVGNNELWKVGLLLQRTTGSVHSESLQWSSQQVAAQSYYRPDQSRLVTDAATFAPVLVSRTIVQDGTTYRTTYAGFDSYGNPATIAESGNATRSRSLTWFVNPSRWIIHAPASETISGVGTIQREYDGDGNLIFMNRYGVIWRYVHSGTGDVAQVIDPRGVTTIYNNYKRGIPQQELHPEGVTISRTVGDAGTVTSETDGRGFITRYGYDGVNRLTRIDHPVRNDVTIAWAATTRTLTRGAFREVITYDGFGRAVKIDESGVATVLAYDALGRKVSESSAGYPSLLTRYAYDMLDRQIKLTHADGSAIATQYLSGNVISTTDERGKVTRRGYRSYGDPTHAALVSLTAPVAAASVTIERNGLDQVTRVTQAGLSRAYGYDSHFYLVSESDPETGVTRYGRDAIGNMTSRQVGASGQTTFTYDGLDRNTAVHFLSAQTGDIANSYDKAGNLVQTARAGVVHSYAYDGNNFLVSEHLSVDGQVFDVAYTPDGNGQLSAITYPSGRVVSFAPDALGRPTKAAPFVTAVSYFNNGHPSAITFANGKRTTYALHPTRLWPTAMTLPGIFGSTFQYDAAGNMLAITDSVDATLSRSLGYDDINRLVKANGPWGSGALSYDGAGNIRTQVLGTLALTYSYDAGNRLQSVSGGSGYSFSYDVYGNVTSNGTISFAYDDASDLRQAGAVSYQFDGTHSRVKREQSGQTVYTLFSHSGQLLMELAPAGGTLVDYVYLGPRLVAKVERALTASATSVTKSHSLGAKPVSLTARVTGASPKGQVSFFDNGRLMATVLLVNGRATTGVQLSSGRHRITAQYAGDVNNGASESTAPLTFGAGAIRPAIDLLLED